MSTVLEQDVSTLATPMTTDDAEAIAQRGAQFQETMALLESKQPRQRGASPTASQIREFAYEEREGALG